MFKSDNTAENLKTIEKLLHNRGLGPEYIKLLLSKEVPEFISYRPNFVVNALKLLTLEDKIAVYFDPDPDGLIAGYLVTQLLDKLGLNYITLINKGRTHGFLEDNIDYLVNKDITLVICVDFLVEKHVADKLPFKAIIIDHHEIPSGMTYVEGKYVLINNQYVDKNNTKDSRCLSGAGMVYYTIYWFLKLSGMVEQAELFKEKYRILVGITLISDTRDLNNVLAYYFLHYTYNQTVKDNFYVDKLTKLGADTAHFNLGIPRLDRNFIDFTLSPAINGVFRFGLGTYAVQYILNLDEAELFEDMAIIRKLQSRVIALLTDFVRVIEFEGFVFASVELSDDLLKELRKQIGTTYSLNLGNFVGLVASRLRNKYSKVVWVTTEAEFNNRGSVRGVFNDINYIEIFEKYMRAKGHWIAFGTYKEGLIDLEHISDDIVSVTNGRERAAYLNHELVSFGSEIESGLIYEIARVNTFLTTEKRIYLKIPVNSLKVIDEKKKIGSYEVQNIPIKGFFPELLSPDLLLPILVNDLVCIYRA